MSNLDDYRTILGEKYVLTGADTAKWSRDWPGAFEWTPLAVIRPANTDEVSSAVKIANRLGHSIVPVSGMTGLCGGASAEGQIMLSLDRLNKIEDIRPEARIATVQAGVVLSAIHDAAGEHDLVFPLTFGAKGSAQIGGALSTNAGGSNVVRYGNTRDLCLGIEVVLPNGDLMDLMSQLHKDNTGYNLKHLMIGAEGTLGIITRVVLKLFPQPKAYATATVALSSLDDALVLLNQLQNETGSAVEAFEFMPRNYMDLYMARIEGAREPFNEEYDVNILVEIGTTVPSECTPAEDGSVPLVTRLENTLGAMFESGLLLDAVIAKNEAERADMWARRECAAEVQLANPPFVNTDISVPLDQVAEFIRVAETRMSARLPDLCISSIAHLGDGNLHLVVELGAGNEDMKSPAMELIEEIAQEFGGSFSAEHGIGLAKLSSMQRRKDPTALAAMRAIKHALDPNGIMNPGKVIPDA